MTPLPGKLPDKHLVYGWLARDGKVLFLRRAAGVFNGGRWELPGGTVEPGEPGEAAAVREFAEETALSVRIDGERSRHSWMDVAGREMRIHACVYSVREETREAVVLNAAEHAEFAWLPPARAAELELLPHIRETLA